jgi:nicotinamide riboside kinase
MNYKYEDVLNMARGQIELEKQQALKANRILFSDTEMIAYKVSAELLRVGGANLAH